jgi:TPR repeat protein
MRFASRGRERSLGLLVAALVFAVPWALAPILNWSRPVKAVTAVGATVAVIVINELRARRKQDDERARQVLDKVVQPARAGDRELPRVADFELEELQVRRSWLDVPYIERDEQLRLAEVIGPGRAAVVIGHSMSGKTRMAVEVLRAEYPNAPLVFPESGQGLADIVNSKLVLDRTIIWLDRLPELLNGLTTRVLRQLLRRKAIVLATINIRDYGAYQQQAGKHSRELEVLEWFSPVRLASSWTDREKARLRKQITDDALLTSIDRYGLPEYAGGGLRVAQKFDNGAAEQPLGQALVRAAVDWRRCGLLRPIPYDDLLAAMPIYLPGRDAADSDAAEDSLAIWACDRVNQTVAQLSVVDISGRLGYLAFDCLIPHVEQSGVTVPGAMWEFVLSRADGGDRIKIAHAALDANNLVVAQVALRAAAEDGDPVAMDELGALLSADTDATRPAEAERWIRQAAEAGYPNAMSNLSVLLSDVAPEESAQWLRKAADLRHPPAMYNMGQSLITSEDEKQRGEGEAWLRKAAEAGLPAAMLVLHELLDERPEPAAKAEALTWLRKAAETRDPEAMFNYSLRIAQSSDKKDPQAAQLWMRRAAEAGLPEAMFNVGAELELRGGYAKIEAETWLRKSAEAGLPQAMNSLAILLFEQDDPTGDAETWLRKAADTGLPEAMYNLAQHLHDRGDDAEAGEWLFAAADAGYGPALKWW